MPVKLSDAAGSPPDEWVTRVLGYVSEDGRTFHLDPPAGGSAAWWTDPPWPTVSDHTGEPVRFREADSTLEIGGTQRVMYKGESPSENRGRIAPRPVDEVEHVERGDWVSGWLAVGRWSGITAGYAKLSEAPAGQVVAAFTLMVSEGGYGYSPATVTLLRYDQVRNCVDHIEMADDFGATWSLEGTKEVDETFSSELSDTWPAVVFEHLVNAGPLDVYPLTAGQAAEMCWEPYEMDEDPPPLDHLWRPVDLSED